jgi:SPP1 family predicted phage head-tail adaptor
MLTSAQLARMRTVAERALPGTAVIRGGSLTTDGGGGWTEAFTAAGTVACRVAPISGNEREEGDRIAADSQYVITLPATTVVETDDRIVVAGVTYNVTAVRDRSWEITRRVEARKVV